MSSPLGMSLLSDLFSEGRLWGRLDDVQHDAGYGTSEEHPPRMGFFTDTSVCIGCKACEVACKEWNEVPDDGYLLTGMSYDNTQELGASTWRHVAFVEQAFETVAARPPQEPPVDVAPAVDLGMPSLGVPTHFTELNGFVGLFETTYSEGDFRPELSYGSHFFQELVESGIFYAAVFDDRSEVQFRPELILDLPNQRQRRDPDDALAAVIHVANTPELMLHADVAEQRVVLQW